MRNKRGQIFALYLVFITLFLCGAYAGLYYMQQDDIHGALVSPMGVLKERDSLEIFEGKEIDFIENSLEVASGQFGSNEFYDSFRDSFIRRIMNDEEAKKFLFTSLSINGVEIREQDKKQLLVENVIYPSGSYGLVNGQLSFVRAKISKDYLMVSQDKNKINFPIGFNFEFERRYSISKKDGEFEVKII